MTEKTITVTNIFGKKVNLTKENYVKRWVLHTRELHNIVQTDKQYKEVEKMVKKIIEIASDNFDEVCSIQESISK